jgi:transcriptional regulator with XRE-family HTH domain
MAAAGNTVHACTMSRDYRLLSRQLVRALRGRRSQTSLSKRLGYSTNVLYLWESGRRMPRATELFSIVARTNRELGPLASLLRFDPSADLRDPAALAGVLDSLRGSTRASEVARRCGVSRYIASRWFSGATEPRLSELLMLVDVLALRLVDVVGALVPIAEVPMLAREASELERRRRVAFTHPWSVAVVREIESTTYRRARSHRPSAIGRRLGIGAAEIETCLDALEEAGVVRREGGKYVSTPLAVDTSGATEAERRSLKLHWLDVGRDRLAAGSDGLFSWSVVAVSRADLERLRALHVGYMTTLRQIVGASEPSEVVAVVNAQLFALDR